MQYKKKNITKNQKYLKNTKYNFQSWIPWFEPRTKKAISNNKQKTKLIYYKFRLLTVSNGPLAATYSNLKVAKAPLHNLRCVYYRYPGPRNKIVK